MGRRRLVAVEVELRAGEVGGGVEAKRECGVVQICDEASVPATAHTDPAGAVALARAMARERGGLALIAGSHYLLRYAWTERPAQSSSR